jgi:CBS domain-containing protein
MLARDLMKKDLEVCTLDDTAAKAAEIMARRDCGFIPVVRSRDDWHLEGVLTDRDVALFLGKADRRSSEVRLSEFCIRKVRTVFDSEDVHKVGALMEDAQIHRVPITDRQGKLLGIIALKDLAEEAYKEKRSKQPGVSEKELAEIVESIAMSK